MTPCSSPARPGWFPFTATEVEVVLALYGVLATALSFAGVHQEMFLELSGEFFCIAYVSGLFVHAREHRRVFDFIEEGALHGEGYLAYIRRARRSLFLTHVDDDAPNDELLGLYRRLLDEGVEMRRVLFLRKTGKGVSWVAQFGDHARLVQRVILPNRADVMRWSFVVVDEESVILSVPGYAAHEDGSYAPEFVLRHLLVLHDRDVARVFLRVHGDLWANAVGVESSAELRDLDEYLARHGVHLRR